MKRIAIVMTLVVLATAPLSIAFAAATTTHSASSASTELPWSTVAKVLKKVADQGNYTYQQLVDGYNTGTVSVEQAGTSYIVSVCNADGAVDMIIIDNM
jgi:hypothetical protein